MLAIAAAAFAGQPRYQIIWLDVTGSQAEEAFGINSAGQVVGAAWEASGKCPQLWNGSTPTRLSPADGSWGAETWDINNSGLAVGAKGTAFSWQDGTWTNLAPLGAPYSTARAVNNASQIVGDAWVSTGTPGLYVVRGFLWQNGSAVEAPVFGYDINASGLVAGVSGNTAAYWQVGDAYACDVPVGNNSAASGVNDSGAVVGYYRPGGSADRAFLYQDGTVSDLGVVDSYQNSRATGINSDGAVVGFCYTQYFNWVDSAAFLYVGGQMRNLQSLVDPHLGLSLRTPFTGRLQINDAGQICGTLSDWNGNSVRAYRLEPIDTSTPWAQADADAGDYGYSVAIGGSTMLNACLSWASDDIQQYLWDLDGDGQYDDATGWNPTVSYDLVNMLHLAPGWHVIGLKIVSADGAEDIAVANLQIVPEPATLSLLGLGGLALLRRKSGYGG